jgi:hypothetical protein
MRDERTATTTGDPDETAIFALGGGLPLRRRPLPDHGARDYDDGVPLTVGQQANRTPLLAPLSESSTDGGHLGPSTGEWAWEPANHGSHHAKLPPLRASVTPQHQAVETGTTRCARCSPNSSVE